MQFRLTYIEQAQEGQTEQTRQKDIQLCWRYQVKRKLLLLKTFDIPINYKPIHFFPLLLS
jgi:hypothetical protein